MGKRSNLRSIMYWIHQALLSNQNATVPRSHFGSLLQGWAPLSPKMFRGCQRSIFQRIKKQNRRSHLLPADQRKKHSFFRVAKMIWRSVLLVWQVPINERWEEQSCWQNGEIEGRCFCGSQHGRCKLLRWQCGVEGSAGTEYVRGFTPKLEAGYAGDRNCSDLCSIQVSLRDIWIERREDRRICREVMQMLK